MVVIFGLGVGHAWEGEGFFSGIHEVRRIGLWHRLHLTQARVIRAMKLHCNNSN